MTETTALQFETTEVPASISPRQAEPNPFDDLFPTEEGKALKITLPAESDAEVKAIKKIQNQARKAANTIGKTARVKVENVTIGTGKTAHAGQALTIWTVDQIKRPRKENGNAA